jgi:hypothetical protein
MGDEIKGGNNSLFWVFILLHILKFFFDYSYMAQIFNLLMLGKLYFDDNKFNYVVLGSLNVL